jgi:hypothetical protein
MNENGIIPTYNVGGADGFGSFIWIFGLLILMGMFNGGWGGGNNFANAIGYENLATSNEVQRGFDNQNLQAQTRDILAAVTNGTAQGIAATNQTYHDMQTMVYDKYNELERDIAGIAVGQANVLAHQNECCCSIKMMIQESNQKILDTLAQNKIEALQQQVNALQLQAATAGVLRYPTGWTYNAGVFPPVTTTSGGTTGA